MKLIQIEEIDSTQSYLTHNVSALCRDDREVLVLASKQLSGRGRKKIDWNHYPGGLAVSFTLTPCPTLSLTPLEVGVLLCQFVEQRSLGLKWPNDLFFEGKKCGGIIINSVDEDLAIVGLGLNLLEGSVEHSGLNLDLSPLEFAQSFYRFVLGHRLESHVIIQFWMEKCFHLNKNIVFFPQEKRGRFLGIGKLGEALIQNESSQQIESFFSGSLIIQD